MLSCLKLSTREAATAVAMLGAYRNDKSRIVKTIAVQALADFAVHDTRLRQSLLRTIRRIREVGSPAMRSRGRWWRCELAGAFFAARAIDALTVFVHPILIGRGRPFAANLPRDVRITLTGTESFDSGLVRLSYAVSYT